MPYFTVLRLVSGSSRWGTNFGGRVGIVMASCIADFKWQLKVGYNFSRSSGIVVAYCSADFSLSDHLKVGYNFGGSGGIVVPYFTAF